MDNKSGTYALILESKSAFSTKVGKLGRVTGDAGFYIYVGSAFGPGGVEARIRHHKKSVARPRWHLDYIRRFMVLKEIWTTYDSVKREHQWANVLSSFSRAKIPFSGFGASDCSCVSHLIYFDKAPSFQEFVNEVYSTCFFPHNTL